MKLDIFVLRHIFRKYLCNRNFLEKHNAEDLQDFAQTQLDFEFFLDNRNKDVNLVTNRYAQVVVLALLLNLFLGNEPTAEAELEATGI